MKTFGENQVARNAWTLAAPGNKARTPRRGASRGNKRHDVLLSDAHCKCDLVCPIKDVMGHDCRRRMQRPAPEIAFMYYVHGMKCQQIWFAGIANTVGQPARYLLARPPADGAVENSALSEVATNSSNLRPPLSQTHYACTRMPPSKRTDQLRYQLSSLHRPLSRLRSPASEVFIPARYRKMLYCVLRLLSLVRQDISSAAC